MDLAYSLEQLAQDQLLVFAFPLFIVLILVERWVHRESYTDTKDTFVSISLSILSALVELIPKVLAFVLFMFLHEISPLRDVVGRQWWAWVLLFFLDDFCDDFGESIVSVFCPY